MADFQIATWEKNAIGDNACETLFTKKSKPTKKNIYKLKEKAKLTQKLLGNEKNNVVKLQQDTVRKNNAISKVNTKKLKHAPKKTHNQVHQVKRIDKQRKILSRNEKKHHEDIEIKDIPNQSAFFQAKNKINDNRKQTNLFSRNINSNLTQKNDLHDKNNETRLTISKKLHKTKKSGSLRNRMLEKLKAAKFRYLNEEMYTKEGKDAEKLFQEDPEAFQAYHDGYRQQVSRWPINPLDNIITSINKLPKSHVIADFGCGEGRLAKSVPQKVHSFDLVAVSDHIIACDMSKVPLKESSVNVVVFCLSLMGTNLYDYLIEASRVLKIGGLLKIAEVESRFQSPDIFIKGVECYGFKCIDKDFSHNLFYFFEFKKGGNIKKKNKLPKIVLNPCLYKKR